METAKRDIVVLVVEDDELVRSTIADLLEEEGFRPLEARNAGEALVLLEARPDVAVMLTDWNMPGMDGPALACRVYDRWPHIGLIVASGRMYDLKGLPPGARFLKKPFAAGSLGAFISSVRAKA